jgi:uncharacterized protein YdeI (YjbR/CyaY-like superfamily)
MAALRGHHDASTVWAQLTDEQRDNYLDWIGKDKTTDRRHERVAKVVKLLPSLPAMTKYRRGAGGVWHGGAPGMP